MFELFILGELMDHPMHGYLLHSIVAKALGPLRNLSWGVLYPLIRRMEAEGLIEQDPNAGKAEGGRSRKVYCITELGRKRFFQLMRDPADYTQDTVDWFHVKLAHIHLVDTACHLSILREYEDYVTFMIDHQQKLADDVAHTACIQAEERGNLFRVFGHATHLLEADHAWITNEIARLTGSAEPGKSSD